MESSCAVCGFDRASHASMNHEFSTDGQLVAKKPEEEKKPPRVVPAPDIILRSLLIRKGLITNEDLTAEEVKIREHLAASPHSPQRPDPRSDH